MINHWHLINDPSPRRGGAQRILKELLQSDEKIISKLDGRTSPYGKFLRKYSWHLYILLTYFGERPKSIFIHSRCFLPYTWLFRAMKTNVIFYGHAHYRSHPWMFRLFPCNFYIAVSESVCNFFVTLGVPRDKITIIRNPYMGGKFIGNSLIPSSVLKIAYIGGLHTWKGIHKALDLLILYARKSPIHISFSIIGEGPLRDLLGKKRGECPSNLSINFLGYQSAPYSKLSDTPIVLIPSLEEGFGLVAIEAIYQGKIIVHTSILALNEVCKEDSLSFPFKIDNSNSFEKALNQAIDSKGKLSNHTLIRERTQRVESEFGLDRFLADQKQFRAHNHN